MKNNKYEILLIEDDIVLGEAIAELLILNNFEINWLKNGIEALDYLQNNFPDIIVSDLMMPLMDGEELFLKIRKNTKFNDIPFFIITANMDEEVKYRQLENGVNYYIMKPFKIKELIFKIRNVLDFKKNIEKKFTPDPFSKVTIKLSKKDLIVSLNEILLKNIKSNIDITELSGLLFMSKSTLDKKIRKHTNKNISQYIREFKLDYAIKLISLGERNIKSLVHETGFNSFSYFSTSFKAYKNITPRNYIKNIDAKNNYI